MNRAAETGPSTVPWWLDWRGECVAIIASGPSAKVAPVELLRDRIHVVVVNESFKLAPWAEVLYACDYAWWALHKGVKEFKGLKLSHDLRACNEFGLHRIEIEKVGANELLVERPSYVGAGGASGFQALNLAVQFGATGVLMIGMDCTLANGEHWHGRHPAPMNNPCESNVLRWRKAFDGAAGRLQSIGVDVVNCSPASALLNYPKLGVEQALKRWGL